MLTQEKVCNKCGVKKTRADFFKSGIYPSGKPKLRGDCKACASKSTAEWREKNREGYNSYAIMWRAKNTEKRHASEIKHNYGMSLDQYNALLLSQSNTCAICPRAHQPNISRRRLYVDHCHETGQIRGLLCGPCNTGIGLLQDSVPLLERSITYLQKFRKSG